MPVARRKWQDIGFVFTTSTGRPLDAHNVTRWFQDTLERAGLPRQRFHDLRHAHATPSSARRRTSPPLGSGDAGRDRGDDGERAGGLTVPMSVPMDRFETWVRGIRDERYVRAEWAASVAQT